MEDGTVDLRRAVTPLRLIFWGALICLIDIDLKIRIGGGPSKFDLLDDFVGMILITVGVFRLAALDRGPGYSGPMTFAKIVSSISMIKELLDHWSFETGEAWGFCCSLISFAELAAVLLFCRSMRVLCEWNGLGEAAQSWHTTFMLYVVLYALPLGGLYLFSLIVKLSGKSYNVDVGVAALLFLAVLFVPLIHFFVSTSRMKRAIEA